MEFRLNIKDLLIFTCLLILAGLKISAVINQIELQQSPVEPALYTIVILAVAVFSIVRKRIKT